MKSQTLLIVDDDPIFRELLGSYLSDEGFKVLQAANGNEGYKIFSDNKPDLIISDIIMPVCNGIEMAKRISINNNTPIIFMSGYTYNKDLNEVMNSKCWGGIFAKPFEETQLILQIQQLLTSSKRNY